MSTSWILGRRVYAHQYGFGWQREFGKVLGLEIRYVGNRFKGGWTYVNVNNAANRFVIENGFLEEFKRAQRNLQANIAAGRGNTFAYTGVPGTSALPIFLAHFAGIPLTDARNQDPANYTASQFRTASFYDSLSLYRPMMSSITGAGSIGLQVRQPAGQQTEGRVAGKLLDCQPGRGQCGVIPLLQRGHRRVRRPSAGAEPADESRAVHHGQLSVRQNVHLEPADPAHGLRHPARHQRRRSRDQTGLDLRVAVRPRQKVGRRRARLVEPRDRRLGVGRGRDAAERRDPEFRQLPARRDDRQRSPEDVQDLQAERRQWRGEDLHAA